MLDEVSTAVLNLPGNEEQQALCHSLLFQLGGRCRVLRDHVRAVIEALEGKGSAGWADTVKARLEVNELPCASSEIAPVYGTSSNASPAAASSATTNASTPACPPPTSATDYLIEP
jgi:hypothetical protein